MWQCAVSQKEAPPRWQYDVLGPAIDTADPRLFLPIGSRASGADAPYKLTYAGISATLSMVTESMDERVAYGRLFNRFFYIRLPT